MVLPRICSLYVLYENLWIHSNTPFAFMFSVFKFYFISNLTLMLPTSVKVCETSDVLSKTQKPTRSLISNFQYNIYPKKKKKTVQNPLKYDWLYKYTILKFINFFKPEVRSWQRKKEVELSLIYTLMYENSSQSWRAVLNFTKLIQQAEFTKDTR